MSINSVSISGNLTRDMEIRVTDGGMAIGRFGVAVNERRKNRNGDWEDYANFVDCVMFGKRAESTEQYLKKGFKVAIKGRLHYSSWEDRNGGGKRSKLEVVVDDIDFMSSAQSGSNGQQGSRGNNYTPQRQNGGTRQYSASQPAAYSDEDIPF